MPSPKQAQSTNVRMTQTAWAWSSGRAAAARPVSVIGISCLGLVWGLVLGIGSLPASAGSPVLYRVNCGGKAYTDPMGNRWAADRPWTFGSWGYDGGRNVSRGHLIIANTEMAPLFWDEHVFAHRYIFPVPNGTYTVVLYFAATDEADKAHHRRFDILMQGEPVLRAFDMLKQASGWGKAVVKQFDGIAVRDGQLEIGFAPECQKQGWFIQAQSNPSVSAIEVIAAGPLPEKLTATQAPRVLYRVNCGWEAGPYTDPDGHAWAADQPWKKGTWGYRGGQAVVHEGQLPAAVSDPGDKWWVYRSERFGKFRYVFPVPNGKYDVTLHFAECDPRCKDPGSRVFDILIEREELASEYDVVFDADGWARPTWMAFGGVTVSDAAIEIGLRPVKGAAGVCGIEITENQSARSR